MTKADLRKKYKKLRSNLNEETRDALSIDIANKLLNLDIWEHEFYHLFLSIESLKEVNTSFILNILSGRDKHIVISKSNFIDRSLQHFLLTDNTKIKLNKYNIPEPVDGIEIEHSKIDVVFVPLLAFNKNGQRIGYGKGFYDTFLANCKPETIKIGLSFFEVEPNLFPVLSTDIALDYCITPNNTYVF
ncbi:5-formyltetrahydrofolate cyclo-ligase [Lacinutrix chionoecetis]